MRASSTDSGIVIEDRTSKRRMDRLVQEAVSLATTTGMLMSAKGDADVRHTSFTLYPSPVRRCEFNHGLDITPLLNTLTHRIATDHDFLRSALRETSLADENFTGRLLRLLDVGQAPNTGVEFTINRYDFFVGASADPHASLNERGLRLIELNCIAAGIVTQAGLTTALHTTLGAHPASTPAGRAAYGNPAALPRNDTVGQIADAVATAHSHFVRKSGATDARVVMVVVPPFINACDQDMLRWRVWRDHGIDFARLTLAEIAEHGTLAPDGALVVRDVAGITQFTMSVAYFRTGYMPYEYIDERDWRARALIERSTAAACPSVAMQLVGTKKIQQVLGEPGVLERFLDKPAAALVRATLVRQYDLASGAVGDTAVARAMENPAGFVLKPQREGGGNNLYHEHISEVLTNVSAKERAKYVLMERIHSTSAPNVIVRNGKWEKCDVVSELGFFGSIVCVDGEIVENKSVGHCVKSKKSTVDDGGIIIGVAVLDSPRIVD